MKTYFLLISLIFSLTANSQNINTLQTESGSIKQFIGGHLNGDNIFLDKVKDNIKKKGGLLLNTYVPREATIDTNKKIYYTYNIYGQITEELTMVYENASWNNYRRYTYNYHPDGKISEIILEEWWNQSWGGVHKTIFNYYNDGLLIVTTIQTGSSGQWVNYKRSTTNYNYQGQMVDSTVDMWETNLWAPASKFLTVFNTNGVPETLTEQRYNINDWTNYQRTTYEYTQIGSTSLCTLKTLNDWNTGEWRPQGRTMKTFDLSGREIEETTQSNFGGTWTYVSLTRYIYSGNNLYQVLTQQWYNGAWQDISLRTFTYNSDNLVIQRLEEISSSGIWVQFIRLNYVYDGLGNTALGTCEFWSDNHWIPYASQIVIYYNNGQSYFNLWGSLIEILYNDITDNNDKPIVSYEFGISQNYPNPFNPMTTINYSIKESGRIVLKLYNQLGEEIKILFDEEKSPGSYSFNLDMTGYSSGIYFCRLSSGDKSLTQKIMLMK